MFSRMHLFIVNILFNLNKDLIFVNGVSFLHMNCLHHPRYLDKLCKKNPLRLEYLSWLPSGQQYKRFLLKYEFVM